MSEKFLELTQWIYIYENILFSHAGVSTAWIADNHELEELVTLEDINKLPPSEIFGFNGDRWDVYGTSSQQSCTWIRPETLVSYAIPDYIQVVGHTPVKNIVNCAKADGSPDKSKDIWLCDCLGNNQYLIIDNNQFIPKTLENGSTSN